MKNFTFLTACLFICITTCSQTTLLGFSKDSTTGQPMEKTTIRLTGQHNSKISFVTTTDNLGHFIIEKVPAGTYILSAGFVGYNDYTRKDLVIDSTQKELVLDNILLATKSRTLEAIVVTGTKSLVENKIDRIVYNVDKDITSQGGVATDVLRKIPQVTVDVNGNVELLGNPSVRFLIDGKPSTIFGNSVADALQSIPASQIQSIEVMSSPGAKYDAAGTGGIINIILKKNKAQGFSGTVNATAGTRSENGSLNLNYKKNNLAVTGYFSGSSQLKVKTLTKVIRNSIDTASGNNFYLKQQGSNDFQRYGYRAGMGLDWDITSKDNLSFSFGYNHFGNTNAGLIDQYNTASDKLGNKLFDEFSIRNANTKFNIYSVDVSGEYRKKFKKEKQELSLSFDFSSGQNNTYYLQFQQYKINDSIFSGSTSKNPGKDRLSSFAVDYSFPLSKDFLVETGVKSEMESLISDANVYTFTPAVYHYVFDDHQSYSSTFRRRVYAGYLSGTFRLFKIFNVIAGARLEYTINHADYSNAHNVVIPDYNNFGPSLTIAHTFKDEQTLKFSYAYRLERPEYRDLNPFVNLADPHNIVTGNPFIQPEIGNDFQFGYNYNFGKGNSLNAVLLYTYNSPDIKSYTTFYPTYRVGDSIFNNVNVTRRSNIASETRWGLNLSGSFNAASKFTIRPGIQLYRRQTNNIYSIPVKISGFEYRWNINANYQFDHGLVAEAFGSYRSGTRWQGRQAAFSSYSLALRQQLLMEKEA